MWGQLITQEFTRKNVLSFILLHWNFLLICLFYILSFGGKDKHRQTEGSHKDLPVTYQLCKRAEIYTMSLYEQHQSEDRVPGIDTMCCRCWSVFVSDEGLSTFLSVNSGHRQLVNLIFITHPEGAGSKQCDWPLSLSQAHPLYSHIQMYPYIS